MVKIPIHEGSSNKGEFGFRRRLDSEERHLSHVSELDDEMLRRKYEHYKELGGRALYPGALGWTAEDKAQIKRIHRHMWFETVYRGGIFDNAIARAAAEKIPETVPEEWHE